MDRPIVRLADWNLSAVGKDHWVHRDLVASVYLVHGEFVCSANWVWIEGAYPTFDEAAAVALAWATERWSEEEPG